MEIRADMIRYLALFDGEKGDYGVSFPDIDGVVAMGATLDAALLNAENALSDYLVEMEKSGAETASPSLAEEIEICHHPTVDSRIHVWYINTHASRTSTFLRRIHRLA